MTVDLPLAALCIALILYSSPGSPHWTAYVALAAAPLIRETRIILILARRAFWTVNRNFRNVFSGALCALPALSWWLYVSLHTIPDGVALLSGLPFSGLVAWTIDALAAPVKVYGPRADAVLELVALAGIWLAFALAAYM